MSNNQRPGMGWLGLLHTSTQAVTLPIKGTKWEMTGKWKLLAHNLPRFKTVSDDRLDQ